MTRALTAILLLAAVPAYGAEAPPPPQPPGSGAVASPAPPPADPDPVVSLRLSELRALIELGVAQYAAKGAQDHIQQQLQPPTKK